MQRLADEPLPSTENLMGLAQQLLVDLPLKNLISLAQAAGPVAAALALEKFGSIPLLVGMCVLVAISFITSLALPTE